MAKDEWKKWAQRALDQERKLLVEEERQRRESEKREAEAEYLEWHRQYYKCHCCNVSSLEFCWDSEKIETGGASGDYVEHVVNYYNHHLRPSDLQVCSACRKWVCSDCGIWIPAKGFFCKVCFQQGSREAATGFGRYDTFPPIPLFTGYGLSAQEYVDVVRGKRKLKDICAERGLYHPDNRSLIEKIRDWIRWGL